MPNPFDPNQDDAVSTAAVAPPSQSPMMPVQQYNYAANPYAAMGPTANFLNTPDRQAKLGQAYDNFLNQIGKGESGFEKGSSVGAQIFGDVIAPAMALFGKGGSSAAGVALMNQVHQDVKGKRMEKAAQEQHYISALKSIGDIANTTSLKPLSDMMKDYRQGVGQDLKAQSQAESKRVHDQLADRASQREKRLTDVANMHNKLGLAKLGFQYDHLGQIKQLAEESDARLRETAALSAKLRLRGQNLATSRLGQHLQMQAQVTNGKLQEETDKYNSAITKWAQEIDPKTKQYKHLGPDGKPMDVSQLLLSPNLVDTPDTGPEVEPQDEDYAAAIQHLTAPPSAPSAQAAQAVAQPGAQTSDAAQPLQQAYGAGVDGALKFYQANKSPQLKEAFKAKYGKYPEEMLGGNSQVASK